MHCISADTFESDQNPNKHKSVCVCVCAMGVLFDREQKEKKWNAKLDPSVYSIASLHGSSAESNQKLWLDGY